MNSKFKIQNSKFAFVACMLLLALATNADAQQARKLPKIGVLFPGSPATLSQRTEAFVLGMKDFGYIDGKTITIEWRWAEDKVERLPELSAELVKMNPEIIVANGTPAIRAIKAQTKTIPILMIGVGDPVGTGLVQSLARPGGNLTGLSIVAPNLSGKRVELLREIAPGLSPVAALGNPKNPVYRGELKETQDVARSLGLEIYPLEVTDATSLEEAFAAIRHRRIHGFILLTDVVLFSMRSRVLDNAAKLRLAVMYWEREFPDNGGLMSYGPNTNALFRRGGYYVDKILKGAKPADLPVEQPTKFELVINLKTAKQIGLTIPPNVLARADKVIK
jgi:putative ABC transport system substrate-binding protein